MRVIAILAILLGVFAQMLLDGQVFTHALFGLICGLIAIACALFSLRRKPTVRSRKFGAWILIACGLALAIGSLLSLPSTYRYQKQFNERMERIRENRGE